MIEELFRETHILTDIFDNNHKLTSPFNGVKIHHGYCEFLKWKDLNFSSDYGFIVAIAGSNGKDRFDIHNKLKKNKLVPLKAIHKSAYVSKDVITGEGIQILPMACVNPRVIIGDCTIINTSSSIDHESKLGKAVHIGPGAKLAGCVKIGDFSFIGTNATILPNITIGENVIIGAGSVVTKNIPSNSIAYGNPCEIKHL